jgi:hypothetical protein
MSYYATFEPTQEAMDKVKEKDPLHHYLSTDPNTFLQEAKFSLLQLSMKNPENASVKTALFQIKMYVDAIKRIAIHDCIEHAMNQFKEDNELWYSGWDKSRRYCDYEESSVTESAIEDLMMMTFLIDTKDYFNHDEQDAFYDKYNRVREIMDDYYESIYDWYKFEIMEQLVDYRTGEDVGDNWWKKEEQQSKVESKSEETNG